MQKLGRFYTTSEFDREYLRNETRYPKSERHVTENDSSRVRRNKSGELRSTIQKVGHVSLDPPKLTFFRKLFRPLKFLQALDIHKGLIAHTTNWVGCPPKNFKGKHLKMGLKFNVLTPITLRAVVITSRNFTR